MAAYAALRRLQGYSNTLEELIRELLFAAETAKVTSIEATLLKIQLR